MNKQIRVQNTYILPTQETIRFKLKLLNRIPTHSLNYLNLILIVLHPNDQDIHGNLFYYPLGLQSTELALSFSTWSNYTTHGSDYPELRNATKLLVLTEN